MIKNTIKKFSGDRWCLCCYRWNEVYEAYLRGEVTESAVPKLIVSATHKKSISMINGGRDTIDRFMKVEDA